ncbi:hypothetical protein [Rhizobium anhuiense]|uniref:Uncharacterized protein n=1 Tax=Rhizobium anhuiense TaxID=1184720 RepID=A0A3S0XFD5_9HYPH|nr:hypothetical protein [Rhizobium anhuiense]RUL98588.1 hypothetical protein EEQ99_24255 [Rhizobium anhuiense]GGD98216.1 hypothetical protein GCM10008012_47280 [Rhizobium anhuiense]
MLDKIGHVKNPLTVVALFAGIAEVSGTVVLPLLDKDIQHTFVWFLMGFPTLLVGVFFAILHWNHIVLYAPSDFQNEDNFTGLVKASSDAILIKNKFEVVEALDEGVPILPPAASPPTDDPPPADSPPTDDPPSADATSSSGITPVVTSNVTTRSINMDELGLNVRRFASLTRRVTAAAISKIEAERHLFFARDVTTQENPQIVFDAAAAVGDNRFVVEVKYAAKGISILQIQRAFETIFNYARSLSPAQQTKLHFILVVVLGDEASEDELTNIHEKAKLVREHFPFTSEVVIYRFSSLIADN